MASCPVNTRTFFDGIMFWRITAPAVSGQAYEVSRIHPTRMMVAWAVH